MNYNGWLSQNKSILSESSERQTKQFFYEREKPPFFNIYFEKI